MKITAIKPFPLRAGRDIFLVKVETDEGIYGLGEGGCSSRELGQAGVVKHFERFLLGQDPMRIEHIWQQMYRAHYFEGGRIVTAAISAIDIALHDIVGKKLGVPVYQLLGGACRERVLGFITVGAADDPKCLEQCKQAVSDGWPAIRVGIAGKKQPPWAQLHLSNDPNADNVFEPRHSIAAAAEALMQLRAAIPREIPLGIDYHHRLSVAEAASFCQMMPSGTIAFLEEPIRNECPDAYAALRTMTDVPFAIGEEWSSKWQAMTYIERGLTNFCRLDVCNIGGLTEAKKVAGWCEAHYIDLMPHNPLGPVCTAATVHLCFAVNNLAWLEVLPARGESAKDVFPVMIDRNGSYYPLPTRPGLGVEFDEAMAAKHPAQMQEMPHLHKPDGSHTNW